MVLYHTLCNLNRITAGQIVDSSGNTAIIAPVLEAIAITAAVKQRWPEYDPEYTKVIPVRRQQLTIPIFDPDNPKSVPIHRDWENLPGMKATMWRLLGRLFHRSLWLNRGRSPVFEEALSPFYGLTLEPRPIGPFPLLLDYARYNDEWGILGIKYVEPLEA